MASTSRVAARQIKTLEQVVEQLGRIEAAILALSEKSATPEVNQAVKSILSDELAEAVAVEPVEAKPVKGGKNGAVS